MKYDKLKPVKTWSQMYAGQDGKYHPFEELEEHRE